MKALFALGIFVTLAGIGLLHLSRTGINLSSSTDINTYNMVKSKAKSRIHAEFSLVPGWVAIGVD
jgi:hypothetical protein